MKGYGVKKYALAGFAVLLLAIMLFAGCAKKEEIIVEEVSLDVNTPVPEVKEQVAVGNDGVKAGIASDNADGVEIVSSGEPSERMVTLTVANAGRANPFLPDAGGVDALGSYVSSEMILPPENITPSPNAEDVITTKVTGILYDKYSPSAIINIEGSDYLVRSGDFIHNYKVLSIAQNNVTVQLGANIYKAGVGEVFTTEGINYNTISNLENKFGSPKNRK
jgi:hypothetical protein